MLQVSTKHAPKRQTGSENQHSKRNREGNDFETQAKGEAHIICNGYLYAQLASRGRLRAQWAASAVQHGMSLDLGGELVFDGGWKMR